MSDVRIVRCDSYRDAENAMRELLSGEYLDWVRDGMKIAVKVNLVTKANPDSAVTTHPALVTALVKLLKEKNCEVVIGDSPGGLYNAVFLNGVYAAAGMKECEATGATLNRDFSQRTVQFPQGKVAKEFLYTSFLDDCDAVIDFCKLKTHGMMGMSAAAKNMFGVIPGTIKPEYHFRYPNHDDFADMIVDLNEYVKPNLSICDAIEAMEGNGPTKGSPRHIGAVAASLSPHKLDLVLADIIGLDRLSVPTLNAAFKRGLIPEKVDELSVDGNIGDFKVDDFDNIAARKSIMFESESFGGAAIGKFISLCLSSKPKLKPKMCVGCEECARICPAKAIKMENKKAIIDRKQCIKCFCCQEFCPVGAMQTKRPLVARLLNK